MKRSFINLLIAGSVGVLIAVGFGVPAQAAWSPNLKAGEENKEIALGKGETHDGSLYIAGDAVKIEGIVKGDLYCAGRDIEVTGMVEGNVVCGAQNLKVSGNVKNGARLAAQNVQVSGNIAGDLTAMAQNVNILETAKISGDLNGGAQSLKLDGIVYGGLRYGASMITIKGEVKKASDISTEILKFDGNGKISAPLFYNSAAELKIDSNRVQGDITYNPPEKGGMQEIGFALLGGFLAFSFAFITAGMIIALILPRFVEKTRQVSKKRFGTTLLAGSTVVFVTPIVLAMLFITGLGAFLATVMALLWVVILMLSGVFFAYYIGSALLQNVQNILIRMLGGLVVTVALMLITVIQIVAFFAILIIGSGILVRTLFDGQFSSMRYSLAPEPPKPPMPKSLGADKTEKLASAKPKPATKKKTPSTKEDK